MSAGYDAHWRDPLATLQMRSSTYHRLTSKIKALADELAGRPKSCLCRLAVMLTANLHISQFWQGRTVSDGHLWERTFSI